jgi:hypothetical protein
MIGPDMQPRMGVEAYTAPELHRFLVADAVKGHATHLPWAVAAYDRIGQKTGRGAEAAFLAVLDEVEALTGRRAMPVANPTTNAELAVLKAAPQ